MFKLRKSLPKEESIQPYVLLADRVQGFLDEPINPEVHGWVACNSLEEKLVVYIEKGDESKFVNVDVERPDVVAAGVSDNINCGFHAKFSQENFSIAKVKAVIPLKGIEHTKQCYKDRKLFFLHTPKTAGSTVNQILSHKYPDGELLTNIQDIRDEWSSVARAKTALSGHLDFDEYNRNFGDQNRVVISFFREPYAQLASHLYWVRHLSEPEKKGLLSSHDESIQSISKKLSNVDISNTDELASYIRSMDLKEKKLFQNMQVRFLTGSIAERVITQKHYDKACQNLCKIHVVGIVEEMTGSIDLMGELLGLGKINSIPSLKVNPYSYGIDITNRNVREILSPLVSLDLKLYKVALEKFKSQRDLVFGDNK